MSLEVEIDGFSELEADLREVLKKFPQETETELKKNANKLRRNAKKQMESDIKRHSKNIIAKKWRVKIIGKRLTKTAMVFNNAPHAHLIEYGHDEYDFQGNPTGGFVPGTHSLERAAREYEEEVPENFEKMVDKLLRGNDL